LERRSGVGPRLGEPAPALEALSNWRAALPPIRRTTHIAMDAQPTTKPTNTPIMTDIAIMSVLRMIGTVVRFKVFVSYNPVK
jgi:hypothetical protein